MALKQQSEIYIWNNNLRYIYKWSPLKPCGVLVHSNHQNFSPFKPHSLPSNPVIKSRSRSVFRADLIVSCIFTSTVSLVSTVICTDPDLLHHCNHKVVGTVFPPAPGTLIQGNCSFSQGKQFYIIDSSLLTLGC